MYEMLLINTYEHVGPISFLLYPNLATLISYTSTLTFRIPTLLCVYTSVVCNVLWRIYFIIRRFHFTQFSKCVKTDSKETNKPAPKK